MSEKAGSFVGRGIIVGALAVAGSLERGGHFRYDVRFFFSCSKQMMTKMCVHFPSNVRITRSHRETFFHALLLLLLSIPSSPTATPLSHTHPDNGDAGRLDGGASEREEGRSLALGRLTNATLQARLPVSVSVSVAIVVFSSVLAGRPSGEGCVAR